MSSRPLPRRYWSKVDTSATDPSQCWPWTGARSGARYGHFMIDGKFKYAHRLMYENDYGPIPPGLQVMHTCDNPQCVRPSHLKLGTNLENARDRDQKGRSRHRYEGLTADDVRTIRARKANGERVKDICKDYAHVVSAGSIYNAVCRWTWRSVQ